MIWGLCLVVGAHTVLSAGLVLAMVRFLRTTTRLDSEAELDRYRALVRGQMLGVLAMLGLMPLLVIMIAAAYQETGSTAIVVTAPAFVWMLASPWLNRLQKRCRTLPAPPHLRATYDEITRIWDAERWPRFPPTSSAAHSGTDGTTKVECGKHGYVSAVTCSRCGAFGCAECTSAGVLGQSKCAACRNRYESLRQALLPRERRVRLAGIVLTALGISDGMVAYGLLQVLEATFAIRLAALFAGVLAAGAFAVGVMLSNLALRSRSLIVAAALPHLVVVPVGSLAAAYVLYATLDSQRPHPLSAEYAEAVAMTGWKGNRHVVVGLFVMLLFIPLYVGSLQAATVMLLASGG